MNKILYLKKNGRFVIFTRKDVLKPNVSDTGCTVSYESILALIGEHCTCNTMHCRKWGDKYTVNHFYLSNLPIYMNHFVNKNLIDQFSDFWKFF